MFYLLDANVLIDANRDYYPLGRVPEFWDWLRHQGHLGNAAVPFEIFEIRRQAASTGCHLAFYILQGYSW